MNHLRSIKHQFCGIALCCMSITVCTAQTPTNSNNYIMETVVKQRGHKILSSIGSLPVESANRTIQYFDGLGRPLQNVQWKASPSRKDIVLQISYDIFGRETSKYLPYAEQYSNDASFKTAAATNQSNYYNPLASWDANVIKTIYPTSITVFEPSPLNRLAEQGAPGIAWQPYSSSISGSGHTVKFGNSLNVASEVALWTINSWGASTSSSYLANKLYKTTTKDENWSSGNAGIIEEFKDMQGKLILKRIWDSANTSLSTYFVYDDYNNRI